MRNLFLRTHADVVFLELPGIKRAQVLANKTLSTVARNVKTQYKAAFPIEALKLAQDTLGPRVNDERSARVRTLAIVLVTCLTVNPSDGEELRQCG